MSVIDTDTWSKQHWIFEHCNNMQGAKNQRTNKWLEQHYHDLSMEYGEVEYEETERILTLSTTLFQRVSDAFPRQRRVRFYLL